MEEKTIKEQVVDRLLDRDEEADKIIDNIVGL